MQKVKYKGKQYKSLTFACDLLGVSDALVRYYTRNGMTFEQAVDRILDKNKLHDHLGNEFESIKSMALAYWLPPTVLYQRLHRKWDLKRALTTPDGKPRGKHASKIQRQKI